MARVKISRYLPQSSSTVFIFPLRETPLEALRRPSLVTGLFLLFAPPVICLVTSSPFEKDYLQYPQAHQFLSSCSKLWSKYRSNKTQIN